MPHISRSKVLLVAPGVVATFSRQDLRLLESEFGTALFSYTGLRSMKMLRENIAQADVVLIWFAGRHAVPAVWHARRLRKPVITIVGGYEAQWIPELAYGVRPGSFRHRALAWVLRHSDRILTVSTITDTGIKAKVDDIAPKCRLVYNAVDTDLFVPDDTRTRRGVICVGQIMESTIDLKGWRVFWELARRMPNEAFTAIGPADAFARAQLIDHRPSNLTWIDELPPADLVGHYRQASVYVQASLHESFSLAVAESMACGCIPVTTRGGALPEVAGETGYFMDRNDLDGAAGIIQMALAADADQRERARARVLEHFTVVRRRAALCATVREVLAAHQ